MITGQIIGSVSVPPSLSYRIRGVRPSRTYERALAMSSPSIVGSFTLLLKVGW